MGPRHQNDEKTKPERLLDAPSWTDAHISHFTTKRLKSRKQSVIGVVAIMFTKTLKGTKSEWTKYK